MIQEPPGFVPPKDASIAARLLDPGEVVLRISGASPSMRRGGIVAIAWAVPAFAMGAVAIRKVLAHVGTLGVPDASVPFVLFLVFGLFWIVVGVRLVWEPWRLHRLYPHVFHLLTDRRFLEVDRRKLVLHEIAFTDIWKMKTFSPFDRLTVWRRGFATNTGKRARVRNFDGVVGVEAVARTISEQSGVPVGLGRAEQLRTR